MIIKLSRVEIKQIDIRLIIELNYRGHKQIIMLKRSVSISKGRKTEYMERNIFIVRLSGDFYPAFVYFLQSSLQYIILHIVPLISYLTCSSYLPRSTSCPVRPLFLTWTVITENQSWLSQNVESTQQSSCLMAKSPVNNIYLSLCSFLLV